MVFGELLEGAVSAGARNMVDRVPPGNLGDFGNKADQCIIASHYTDEWYKTVNQEAEIFRTN